MEVKENTEESTPVMNISSRNNFSNKIRTKIGFLVGLIFVLIVVLAYFALTENINIKNQKFANTLPTITPGIAIHISKQAIPIRKETIGFLPSWSVANKSKVYPENLTQIIYFGLTVNKDGNLIKYNEENLPVLEWTYFNSDYFTEIRKVASKSGTKVLLSIKSFDNETIDNVISSKTATNRLADQLLILVKQYDLGGVNIDFEYFTDTTFPTAKYFANFLTELSSKLKNNNPESIVSLDVNATVVIKDKAYNMTEIAKSVDQIILMAYDYRQQNSTRAGPVSPINGDKNEHSILKSVESLSGRVPNDKLILAIPFYGYEWQTINKNNKSPVVPGTGALATYKRAMLLLEENDSITEHWDDISKSPWISFTQYGKIKQIYYENDKSIIEKINYSNENKFGGIAIWALGYEGDNPVLWEIIDRTNYE